MRRYRYLLLLAVLGYLATGAYSVGTGERAAVRRFGRIAARPGPGLWVGLPWGIDRVDRVRVHTARQLTVGAGTNADDDVGPDNPFLTGDHNLVDLKLVVEYTIDVADGGLDDYAANRGVADGLLAREVEAAAAEWIAVQSVDDVLLAGRAALPQWLAGHLPDRLAPLRLGVIVQRVSVERLAAPAEVRDAFDAVAQAQAGIRTQENAAHRQAAALLRDAEVERSKLTAEADANRREKLALAAADAESFTRRLDEYRRLRIANPDVLTAIWWDEVGRTLLGMKGRGRVDLLDAHLGPDGLDVTQFVPPSKK